MRGVLSRSLDLVANKLSAVICKKIICHVSVVAFGVSFVMFGMRRTRAWGVFWSEVKHGAARGEATLHWVNCMGWKSLYING